MGNKETNLTFPALFGRTLKNHPESNAYAFVGEEPISWTEAAGMISSVTALLESAGIVPGDKVAILSTNMPNWAISYFAVVFMGAVAVPILPDFSPTEILNVIEHSETRALFVSSGLKHKTDGLKPGKPETIFNIEDFTVLSARDGSLKYTPGSLPLRKYEVTGDDLASIIYTSGTTGRSKGVMLTHKNICFNALKGELIQPVNNNDRFLSVLPLSHTYENTLGLILPMLGGSCVYYLRKPPTPPVLLPALETVKPTIMLTVPLIIEKVYYNKILPSLTGKWFMKQLYNIPFIRKKLNRIAGVKLLKTFGDNLKFFGIGGSKLNRTVERFLLEARFPYAIGYGLTETSPLLAGANPEYTVFDSTGPAIDDIELIINNPDPKTGEGEIWARGDNVMKGYYREPEMTAEVLTPDGWFKTGDLGVFDSRNNLYIKGRLKNMIVGASGENIYPEEIESVINNFRFVMESLVIQQKGKLVAYVHLNMEELERKYRSLKQDMEDRFEEKIQELILELMQYVNTKVNKFSQINKVVLQPVPFQKTATLKIKRFLYI